jgi:hypothetical protein
VGKWTREDLKKVKIEEGQTRTEEVNGDIISNCTPALDSVFRLYYKRIGKPTYNFILQEEIGKVSKMTPEEFDKFIATLGDSQ